MLLAFSPSPPLSVESLTPRTSTYSTLRYELWKLERVLAVAAPRRRAVLSTLIKLVVSSPSSRL
jgi:hypothetical protein